MAVPAIQNAARSPELRLLRLVAPLRPLLPLNVAVHRLGPLALRMQYLAFTL